jgi:hypothetical protein
MKSSEKLRKVGLALSLSAVTFAGSSALRPNIANAADHARKPEQKISREWKQMLHKLVTFANENENAGNDNVVINRHDTTRHGGGPGMVLDVQVDVYNRKHKTAQIYAAEIMTPGSNYKKLDEIEPGSILGVTFYSAHAAKRPTTPTEFAAAVAGGRTSFVQLEQGIDSTIVTAAQGRDSSAESVILDTFNPSEAKFALPIVEQDGRVVNAAVLERYMSKGHPVNLVANRPQPSPAN